MDSVERFDETELPSQDAFFNKLSGSSCSDIDCAHASRVWDAFGCETIVDIHCISTVYLQYIYSIFTVGCVVAGGFLREIPKNLLGFLQS